MDNNTGINPIDKDLQKPRIIKLAMLGAAAVGICILFVAAFIGFRPDQLSLSDRYFPSPTPTFTRTPTPTPTPNLTATQQVIQSTATAQAIQTTIANAGNQWPILFEDQFDANSNHWATGLDDDEYARISREVKNGKYIWDTTSKKGFVGWITADTKSVIDFYLSVEAQRIEGSSSDYGLIFRNDTKDNFYYFAIADEGFFVSLNYNDEWKDVIDWTQSSAIVPEAPNRMTIIAENSHFIFLINDQYVADVTDEHILKGTTALAIQVYEADLKANFEFDNLELRTP